MTDTQYNGWTNYETWLTKLWMDNDESSQDFWIEEAQQRIEDDDTRSTFAQSICDHYEEAASELVSVTGVFADLLGAALSEVNWYEIAESLMTDATDIAAHTQ